MSFSFSLRQWISRSHTPTEAATQERQIPGRGEALFSEGLRFATGQELTQDYVQAAGYYVEAAELDHILAQVNLATLYEQGRGVERDNQKAAMWLTKAANLGDAAAQYRLGVRGYIADRSQVGESGKEGRVEALKWVRLSAAQGYKGAEDACEFVALCMTLEEVAESSRRVAAFVQRPDRVI